MVLIIDNYDSFTYNLYQQIGALGWQVLVKEHDAISINQIRKMQPSHIVISPGPKTPKYSGISNAVIESFYQDIPILGVCLGHQCIGEVFGSNTVQAPQILHGKTSRINHNKKTIFKSLVSPITAAQYNSLVVDSLPPDFELGAWSEDGTIMAFSHKKYPLHGVQFHPESFMTGCGTVIMENFLACHI